jgi:charged multivesicular body protein 4
MFREELRDQHAIVEEIGEAITQSTAMQGVDETELEDELEALQQEELDNRMLATGTVPVGDKVGAMPSAPQGGKQNPIDYVTQIRRANGIPSQRKSTSCGRRRRGSRITETPSRNGTMKWAFFAYSSFYFVK